MPWTAGYYSFQSKLEVLQFDVFSLPQVSCLAPGQTFFTTYKARPVSSGGTIC